MINYFIIMTLLTPTASIQYVQIFKIFRPKNLHDPTLKKQKNKISKNEILQELKMLK
jgi:hypothetical protein